MKSDELVKVWDIFGALDEVRDDFEKYVSNLTTHPEINEGIRLSRDQINFCFDMLFLPCIMKMKRKKGTAKNPPVDQAIRQFRKQMNTSIFLECILDMVGSTSEDEMKRYLEHKYDF